MCLNLGASVCLWEGGVVFWPKRGERSLANNPGRCEREQTRLVAVNQRGQNLSWERKEADLKLLTLPTRPPAPRAPLLLKGMQAWT